MNGFAEEGVTGDASQPVGRMERTTLEHRRVCRAARDPGHKGYSHAHPQWFVTWKRCGGAPAPLIDTPCLDGTVA